MNEEKCIYCETFEHFKELMLDGETMEDAFHTTTSELVGFVIEDVLDSSFSEDYLSAMQNIKFVAEKAIEQIEGECDCDECKAERGEL